MNDDTSPMRRLELLAGYLHALERGDMAQVEAVLGQARHDAILEQLLLEANDMYQGEEIVAATAGEIGQARQRLAELTPPAETLLRLSQVEAQPSQVEAQPSQVEAQPSQV